MRTLQNKQIRHLSAGMSGMIELPVGAEMITVGLDANLVPTVTYLAEQASYEPRAVVLVGNWQAVPDVPLRWVGSWTVNGWQETHLFEVL